MNRLIENRDIRRRAPCDTSRDRGFSLIELLIGMTVLAVGLLGIASMFSTGYTDVTAGGKTTTAQAAARQILEDVHAIPFDNLANLDGFSTSGPLPANDPERTVAQRWRDSLVARGWTGQISVVNQTATLRLVTITLPVPGRSLTLRLATLITRL